MRDSDVRSAVLNDLAAAHAGDARTIIVEEMGVWNGSARIDIAVINGQMHGFELKSARDTLTRLQQQSELYNQVFDRITLVTAERHAEKAGLQIPDWWGISIVTQLADASCVVRVNRVAMPNPKVNPVQLARLLWNDERRIILERYNLLIGHKTRSAEHWNCRLAECLPLDTLASEVRETLKQREGWLRQSVCH